MAQTPIPYPDPDDAEGYYTCPADGGDHAPDTDTIVAAFGYIPSAEKGIVVALKCSKCFNGGNYKIPLDDILW